MKALAHQQIHVTKTKEIAITMMIARMGCSVEQTIVQKIPFWILAWIAATIQVQLLEMNIFAQL